MLPPDISLEGHYERTILTHATKGTSSFWAKQHHKYILKGSLKAAPLSATKQNNQLWALEPTQGRTACLALSARNRCKYILSVGHQSPPQTSPPIFCFISNSIKKLHEERYNKLHGRNKGQE